MKKDIDTTTSRTRVGTACMIGGKMYVDGSHDWACHHPELKSCNECPINNNE